MILSLTAALVNSVLARETSLVFSAKYVHLNENSEVDINREIKANLFAMQILKLKSLDLKKSDLKLNGQVVNASDIIKQSLCRAELGGVNILNEEESAEALNKLEVYIRLRMNGVSIGLAEILMNSGDGIQWNDFLIPSSSLNKDAPPKWMKDYVFVPSGTQLFSIYDDCIRRFLIVKDNKVTGEFALDFRDSSETSSRGIKIINAFNGVERRDEISRSYYLRVSQFLLENYGLMWVSPSEIPAIGDQ